MAVMLTISEKNQNEKGRINDKIDLNLTYVDVT